MRSPNRNKITKKMNITPLKQAVLHVYVYICRQIK